jgi:hypothetical protein
LVRDRLGADRSYIAGKAAFWRLVGCGALAFGLGTACGLTLYGYSYIRGNSDNLNLLSSALSKELSEVHLQASATGTVQVEPNTVVLAKDQTVMLDPNSRLLLDQAAAIRVDGEISVQAPSVSVPTNSVAPSRPSPHITSNFTVFKRVPFDKGFIVTGWMFLTSVQKAPSTQVCYYTRNVDEFSVDLDIAKDQKLDSPKRVPEGFDVLAAFNKCVWFRA